MTDQSVLLAERIAEAERVLSHAEAWRTDGYFRTQAKPEWILADAEKCLRDLLSALQQQSEEITSLREERDRLKEELKMVTRVDSTGRSAPNIDAGQNEVMPLTVSDHQKRNEV